MKQYWLRYDWDIYSLLCQQTFNQNPPFFGKLMWCTQIYLVVCKLAGNIYYYSSLKYIHQNFMFYSWFITVHHSFKYSMVFLKKPWVFTMPVGMVSKWVQCNRSQVWCVKFYPQCDLCYTLITLFFDLQ